jgi:hypothetical protein
MKTILGAALLVFATASLASAGPIERACVRSDRQGATRALCDCIDGVGRKLLNNGDQRKAASFYKNPELAQEIRQSTKVHNEEFWKRYQAYVAAAEQMCAVPVPDAPPAD